ncbi:MAG: sigma-70 family RNA polymerase sigma factor, partial [Cyclobacteriaceae bacterium]|nr:sigma-70 family RNA polymerase sigma factor [Cyclobacteriaceae bacterium]
MRQLKITKQITNRETQSLDKYLSEIARIDLITAEMEVQLAKRIREGDKVALEKMVNANLRFVVSVAKQYQNHGLTLSDLINEGNLGLIKAATRFDETRGFKFISYAVWWIRQSILQALAEQSRIVRLPLNRVGSLNKINNAFSELEQKHQREPTEEELAEIMEMTPDEIRTNLAFRARKVSMDAPFAQGDGDGTLLDIMEDEDADVPDSELMTNSLQTEVKRALATLSEREAAVISLYYGLSGGQAVT